MAFTWGKGSLFLASTYWLNIWCNDGQTGIRRWRWFLVFLIVITLFSDLYLGSTMTWLHSHASLYHTAGEKWQV